MSPGMRPAGIQPDMAEEGAIKPWLEALASGSCDAPAFLHAMQERFRIDADGTWEVLSQLDQYYRRGRIEPGTFKTIKTALAEMALGHSTSPPAPQNSAQRTAPPAREPDTRDVPVARDIVVPAHVEHTDVHLRREESHSSESPGEPKPGSVLRRRYRIEAILGQGRMGTVFQALDEFRLESPGTQRLALKVLHPSIAKRAELLAELRREFQALQLLSHPNIIRVFDFDRDGVSVFFTMELLTGTSLGRLLQARNLIPLERPQALALIRDIGAALTFAHSRGVLHGDLNLQNIFVTSAGELRVMNFGSSHKVRQAAQAPDSNPMLPFSASNYASAQVLEGERADVRDDIFSLACVTYLMLSGVHPFAGNTATEAREARLRIPRPANLSGRQWQALRTALHWERDDRPADLQRWLAQLGLDGAARRLTPLNDLMELPAARKSRSWLIAGVTSGLLALIFAAYWITTHQDLLPSVDSTATIRAPVPAPPPNIVAPPPDATPVERTKPTAAPIAASVSHAAPAATPAPPAAAPPTTTPIMTAPAPAPVAAFAGASKVELSADTIDVPSGESSAQVPVHRRGNLRGETSFTWWTESGTAKPGADFSAVVPQLAHIADGKSNVSLSIPVGHTPHAQAKSFYVVIDQSEGGATLGARTLTMVTLLPSDAP
jgi:serine/threonine protein kinase